METPGAYVFVLSGGDDALNISAPRDKRARRLPIPKGSGVARIFNHSLADLHFSFNARDLVFGGITIKPGAVFTFAAYPTKLIYRRGRALGDPKKGKR